jgi:hypothetical protein
VPRAGGRLWLRQVGTAVANLGRPVAHGWVRTAVVGGVAGGIVGAAALALAWLAVGVGLFLIAVFLFGSAYAARFARGEISAALKIPAYPFVGHRVFDLGFDGRIVLLGVVTHLVCWICWGALFGLVAHERSWPATIALGVLSGIAMWGADSYVMLASPAALVQFILAGLAMAITFLWYQRHVGNVAGPD